MHPSDAVSGKGIRTVQPTFDACPKEPIQEMEENVLIQPEELKMATLSKLSKTGYLIQELLQHLHLYT